ncbi:MAG: hypothetical protein SFY69_05350 [Planctomycetota bacterium]|nr:hypothetical protein [Planctomycetota bacterium]
MRLSASQAIIVFGIVAAMPPSTVRAGVVYLNDAYATSFGARVAGFKYRVSNTNFDVSLDNGGGTSVLGAYLTGAIGNTSQLSGVTYELVVAHEVGEGFTFSMTPAGAASPARVLFWGPGQPPAGATSAVTLGGVHTGGAFNTLLIEARATLNGSTMAFSQLSFTSPTLTIAGGGFETGSVTPATRGPSDTVDGMWTQRISADADLSAHDWTFSARVTATRNPGGGGDEALRFTVGAGTGTVVPSAGGETMLATAGLLLAMWRRRGAPTNGARTRNAEP